MPTTLRIFAGGTSRGSSKNSQRVSTKNFHYPFSHYVWFQASRSLRKEARAIRLYQRKTRSAAVETLLSSIENIRMKPTCRPSHPNVMPSMPYPYFLSFPSFFHQTSSRLPDQTQIHPPPLTRVPILLKINPNFIHRLPAMAEVKRHGHGGGLEVYLSLGGVGSGDTGGE